MGTRSFDFAQDDNSGVCAGMTVMGGYDNVPMQAWVWHPEVEVCESR